MKLAFLIAAHDHPELLARLVKRLDGPQTSVHIHIDKRSDLRPFQDIFVRQRIQPVHWVPRVRSTWGTFGQVQASLSLLRHALAKESDSDVFILLSGQDYPLLSLERMQNFFQEKKGVNFLGCARLPWEAWRDAGGLDRVRHYHFFLGRYSFEYPSHQLPPSHIIRTMHSACSWVLPRVRRIPDTFTLYGGSNWWNLTREAAQGILDYVQRNPSFPRLFRCSRSSDEIFFQTALMNSGRTWPLENNDLRCAFWDGRRNEHPVILRMEDFDEVARSGKLFARKVHPQTSAGLLDRIDAELLR